MREYQKENSFLKQIIHYQDPVERSYLEKSIERAEHNERTVLRAVRFVIVLAAFSLAGLAYSVLLLSELDSFQLLVTAFSAIALASLGCLPVFLILWIFHRVDCNERRDECRRSITALLAEKLGEHPEPPRRANGLSSANAMSSDATVARSAANGGLGRPLTI